MSRQEALDLASVGSFRISAISHLPRLLPRIPVMTRLRCLLTWLLLLALPMQALAAASMLGCGPASQAGVRTQAQQDGHQHHGDGAADHAHHATGTDASGASSSVPDSGHSCGACAACCHSIGIGGTAYRAPVMAPATASWSEPYQPVLSRPSPVPDKPPRG
jgi:hypothetical protein